MKPENEKYFKIVEILRKSSVDLDSTQDIEREVLRDIEKYKQPVFDLSAIVDVIFGWAYIGWVRRSLIAVALILLLIFIYQQGVILRQLDYLRRQTLVFGTETVSRPSEEIEKLLLMYKISGIKFRIQNNTFSEEDVNQLFDVLNRLQVKYEDLLNSIDEDPVLKDYIRNKLNENNRKVINL